MFRLYLINFLLAFSTTIGMTITPLITTEVFGASILLVGFIEGGTEFLANLLKLFSGSFFDRVTKKDRIFSVSCLIATISKTFLLTLSPLGIFAAKITERIANGMFSSPRDAYTGVFAKKKSYALGLMFCTKTAGCMGATILISLSSVFFGLISKNYIFFIYIAIACSTIALIFSFFIKNNSETNKHCFEVKNLKNIIGTIKLPLLLSCCFFLGRFNDGMIMLFLKSKGFDEWYYSATIGIFNFFMFFVSPIVGYMLDRKRVVFIAYLTGFALLFFNIIFFNINSKESLILTTIGLMFWGIQRVSSQLVFASMIFSRLDKKDYGTGIGIYSAATGLCVFIASACAGYVSSRFNLIFLCSGVLAVVFLISLFLISTRKTSSLAQL